MTAICCHQAAALQVANVNYNQGVGLTHTPPNTWRCWTQQGYSGAESSNLAIGTTGARAVIA